MTSLIVVALRKLQMWTYQPIIQEMLRFSPVHGSSERFLEQFGSEAQGVPLIIPDDMVPWLWNGIKDEDGLLPQSEELRVTRPKRVMVQYRNKKLDSKWQEREGQPVDESLPIKARE
jgi:Tyrosine phosphatase family